MTEMMMSFNPSDWYWVADDGRVFSTARMIVTDKNDAGYKNFVQAQGGSPSWPLDEHGAQTIQSIRDVIVAHGGFASLNDYAAAKRDAKETAGIVVGGVPVATDDRTKQMIIGARLAVMADPSFTTPWVGSDGSIHTLAAADIIAISNAVLAYIQSCFEIFVTVNAGISDNTITTRAQVDAAFDVQ